MEALDEVKEKIPEDAYLMLCDASKEKYTRLEQEESGSGSRFWGEDRDGRNIHGENTIYNGIQQSITIPPSITTIPSRLFRGCPSLTGVTFTTPSSVRTIGDSAFEGCSSLCLLYTSPSPRDRG